MSLSAILDIFQHLPEHIALWTVFMGPWIYGLLFAIIFAETGLVFAPFLPGDSLLFAVGALTAMEGPLNLFILLPILTLAAMGGDFINYCIGRKLGLVLFRNPKSKLFNRKYLYRAEHFYGRHGGKAVVLARFLPIIRTYAPFVAGVSRMPIRRYIPFNMLGGCAWISLFLLAGHWFGNLPFVKTQFHYVILAIVLISAAPALIELIPLIIGGKRGNKQKDQ
jgi:membrane-associated protein